MRPLFALLSLPTWMACFAQPAEKPLSFEVVSVKPASKPIATKDSYTEGYNAGTRAALAGFGIRVTGQHVAVTDNTLRDLIRQAYEVKDYQISGPAWIAEDKFEIAATMPAGATRREVPGMMRSLLERRFHLKVRREMRKTTVYALVPGKSGAKLTPASAARGGPGIVNPGRIAAIASSLAAFADLLSKASSRPVMDATDIAGSYDFDLRFAPETDAAADAGPTMEAALREQYGLRLEKREKPVEFLVVEQADRTPVEN